MVNMETTAAEKQGMFKYVALQWEYAQKWTRLCDRGPERLSWVNWKGKQILYRFNCITQSFDVVAGTFNWLMQDDLTENEQCQAVEESAHVGQEPHQDSKLEHTNTF